MRFDQVLVTGGAGRLGRYVVRELAGRCHVTVLDREEQAAAPVDLPAPFPPVDFPVDVLDLDALRSAMRGQHAVVHLAAIDSSVTAPRASKTRRGRAKTEAQFQGACAPYGAARGLARLPRVAPWFKWSRGEVGTGPWSFRGRCAGAGTWT